LRADRKEPPITEGGPHAEQREHEPRAARRKDVQKRCADEGSARLADRLTESEEARVGPDAIAGSQRRDGRLLRGRADDLGRGNTGDTNQKHPVSRDQPDGREAGGIADGPDHEGAACAQSDDGADGRELKENNQDSVEGVERADLGAAQV